MDAKSVPEPVAPKTLSERVAYAKSRTEKSAPLTKSSANPKAQPKSAVRAKPVEAKKGKNPKAKKARNPRPKAKTAEELDAEMTDYWGGNNAANGAAANTDSASVPAATATGGDEMGMEEISVSQPRTLDFVFA